MTSQVFYILWFFRYNWALGVGGKLYVYYISTWINSVMNLADSIHLIKSKYETARLKNFKMLLSQSKKSFVDVLKKSYCELPGVNFTNTLRAHFL